MVVGLRWTLTILHLLAYKDLTRRRGSACWCVGQCVGTYRERGDNPM